MDTPGGKDSKRHSRRENFKEAAPPPHARAATSRSPAWRVSGDRARPCPPANRGFSGRPRQGRTVSKEKQPLVVEMGSHLLTKPFGLFPMRRKDCAVGRETDSVSELLYEGRFTGSNIFIEYNSRHPIDGRNPPLKSLLA